MTYFYDNYVGEHFGKIEGNLYNYGTYITPDGKLFDVDGFAKTAHNGGFVLPFFMELINPKIEYYPKEYYLDSLVEWYKELTTKTFGVNPKEQQMRLCLVKYLLNVYKSSKGIWDDEQEIVDFSEVTGIQNADEISFGRNRMLKDILVQSCNYDAIESTLYRTITTSKFNIYETFYDYILNGYRIFQIPKKVYDENLERYVNWEQSPFLVSDKELRLKEELESICRTVPLEERIKFCRSRVKINRYDFLD